MNFVSKNLNKARSLVMKLKFVTKNLKAYFQYPAKPQNISIPKSHFDQKKKKKPRANQKTQTACEADKLNPSLIHFVSPSIIHPRLTIANPLRLTVFDPLQLVIVHDALARDGS